ncbi:PaaI family thioesterase [Sphingopyxis sp.]|uniref:PaaI family thioesterase n=1 Tax=Sphingopyxis sp. TaxID=1908224 RepID=UPI003F721673
MSKDVPEGFEPLVLDCGYNDAFGPAYVNLAEHKIGFRVGPQHLNPVGGCHGGAMATFADMQISAVGPEAYDAHRATISLTVEYLAPVGPGVWVEAEVVCPKATRTLVFTQAIITADGEPVARTSGIYRNASKAP